MNIVPKPLNIALLVGETLFSSGTKIVSPIDVVVKELNFLDYEKAEENSAVFEIGETEYDYEIVIDGNIRVLSKTNEGLFHGAMTLKQLVFDGKGIQLFGKYIAWGFLTIITLGIYGLWLPIKMEKWKLKHTYVEETTANAMPAFPQGGFPAPVYPTAEQMQQCGQAFYGYPQYPQYMQYPQYPQMQTTHCCPYSRR